MIKKKLAYFKTVVSVLLSVKKRKIPETSQKQNLNLVHPGNYLHSIYVVLGIISYLEMT